jgi:L-asparagine oxygenase
MVAQQGTPYAVVQEGASLVSDVAAKQGKARSLTGIGSVPLDLHIENAFGRTFQRDLAPAGLALVGVCREPGRSPATPVADARLALAALAPAQAAILREPRFLIARPERWRGPDKAPHRRTAIATGSATAPAFIIATYGDMIKPCDAEAADALAAFIAALERGAVDLAIEPGRLVLIDNRVILHGRRGYRPRFTLAGAPYRWLQRMFWTRALEDFAGWRLAGDHLVDASRPDPE